MATLATLYNQLPTLGEAEERFTERAPLFAALASLLAEYGNFWSLCLVHAHCKLAEGEIMRRVLPRALVVLRRAVRVHDTAHSGASGRPHQGFQHYHL